MSHDYAGFDRSEMTFNGVARTVYRGGSGPAVIVIHEVPGLYPEIAEFGRVVIEHGFSVFMPSLIGTPGRPYSESYALKSMARACVAREFATWATRKTSPAAEWCRALARHAHEECGGPGVGAVGMCLTGGFALAMAVDDTMLAPVLSQPSLPFPLTSALRRDLGIDDAALERIKRRAVDENLCVLGLRFTADRLVPGARFKRLREELGDNFIAVEIDSSRGNAHGIPRKAHSVLVHDFVDEPGHPTVDARKQVLDFFSQRLKS